MAVQQHLLPHLHLLLLPRQAVDDGVDLLDGTPHHQLLADIILLLVEEQEGDGFVSVKA